MNEIQEKLISELPESPASLDKKNVKKIYRYLPVPTDYNILWADISSFSGYPAGVVITDFALVLKATKNEVKVNKKQIKKENKKKKPKDKLKAPKILYNIIPWEYYSPEDYDILEINDDKGNCRFI